MNDYQVLRDDEIDLKELFNTIWKNKKLIAVFTLLVTILAIVFAFTKTPIYEAKVVIEVGSIQISNSNSNSNSNSSAIENHNNLVKRLQILYIDSTSNIGRDAIVHSVSTVKKSDNLVEIVVHSNSNKKAKLKLENIVKDIKLVHQEKIESYRSLINNQILSLKKQLKYLESDKNKFDGSMAVKFDLQTKLDELHLKISPYSIQETKILGSVITNDYPIKPKKRLIVAVAFVTGFILSIFIVFIREFFRKENSK